MQGPAPFVSTPFGVAPVYQEAPIVIEQPAQPVVLSGEPGVFERHDAEYEWFRYSKYALPALLFILATAAVLFLLTIWQANITLKSLRDGVPRRYIAKPSNNLEAGLKQSVRDLRLWGTCINIITIVLILLVMYLKPPAKARKGLYLLLGLILIVGGVLLIIAFGIDAAHTKDGVRCRAREQGNVARRDPCRSLESMVTATAAAALISGVFAIGAAVCLIVAAIKSASPPPTDELGDAGYAPAPKVGVSSATRNLALILVFTTLAVNIILLVFTVFLHEQIDVQYRDEVYGVRRYTNPEPGWPSENTRLRIATSSTVILVVIFALIPFRSRVVAYGIAFVLFLTTVIAFMSFALDVRSITSQRNLECPKPWECDYAPFIATIFFDILLGFVIVLYVIFEYVFRLALGATHVNRL